MNRFQTIGNGTVDSFSIISSKSEIYFISRRRMAVVYCSETLRMCHHQIVITVHLRFIQAQRLTVNTSLVSVSYSAPTQEVS